MLPEPEKDHRSGIAKAWKVILLFNSPFEPPIRKMFAMVRTPVYFPQTRGLSSPMNRIQQK